MKEPFSFEPGRVVESVQGRDRGYFFLVLGTAEGGALQNSDLKRALEVNGFAEKRSLREGD